MGGRSSKSGMDSFSDNGYEYIFNKGSNKEAMENFDWTKFGSGGTSVDPAKIQKIDDRLQSKIGYSIDEAIYEVRSIISNLEDDITVNYLKEQLPKLENGTIKMKDLDEIINIIS